MEYVKGIKIKEPTVFYGLSKLYKLLFQKIEKDFKPLVRRQPLRILLLMLQARYISAHRR